MLTQWQWWNYLLFLSGALLLFLSFRKEGLSVKQQVGEIWEKMPVAVQMLPYLPIYGFVSLVALVLILLPFVAVAALLVWLGWLDWSQLK